jgi:hypothetical protein
VGHEAIGWLMSQSARHTVLGEPTHAKPFWQMAMVPATEPQGSPTPASSSGQAQEPEPCGFVKQARQEPGFCRLHGARQRPATHASPCAHWPLLHAWQVVGSVAPGRQTLDGSPINVVQVLPVAHVVALQALHRPPWPPPPQHGRQKELELSAVSRVQTLHCWQTPETVHGSPEAPRGTQVPPVQVYPVAQFASLVHWLVQVLLVGTQKPSGIWQL